MELVLAVFAAWRQLSPNDQMQAGRGYHCCAHSRHFVICFGFPSLWSWAFLFVCCCFCYSRKCSAEHGWIKSLLVIFFFLCLSPVQIKPTSIWSHPIVQIQLQISRSNKRGKSLENTSISILLFPPCFPVWFYLLFFILFHLSPYPFLLPIKSPTCLGCDKHDVAFCCTETALITLVSLFSFLVCFIFIAVTSFQKFQL